MGSEPLKFQRLRALRRIRRRARGHTLTRLRLAGRHSATPLRHQGRRRTGPRTYPASSPPRRARTHGERRRGVPQVVRRDARDTAPPPTPRAIHAPSCSALTTFARAAPCRPERHAPAHPDNPSRYANLRHIRHAQGGKLNKSIRTMFVAMGAALLMVVVPQTSASAAIYTWLNMEIKPDGRVISDTGRGQANSFSRTGVSASISGASGPNWETKVWFGTYSTTGEATASISGPRSFLTTKARYTFLPGGLTDRDRQAVKAWLLDARMAGMNAVAARDSAPTGSGPGANPLIPEVSADDLRAGKAVGVTLKHEGSDAENEYWSGVTPTGRVCLFTLQDEYVGSTCTDATSFADRGLSQHMSGPGTSTQIALIPESARLSKRALEVVGMERVSDTLAVNHGTSTVKTLNVERFDGSDMAISLVTSAG